MASMGSFRYNLSHKSRDRLLSPLLSHHPEPDPDEDVNCCSCWCRTWASTSNAMVKLWEFGRSDPRKVVFAAKMGLALVLLTLLIFLEEPFQTFSRYSVWAILTVVVVFEFSIGATLSKGLNRGLGTLFAGGLALAVAELAGLTGEFEEVTICISIYIAGFVACFLKLYPALKPYEYGFRVFLITFCFIVVSGYRTKHYIQTAITRFLLISLGACVALAVNIFIFPIWAGEDLHNLVAKNFSDVAKSLEGCVNGYLDCIEYERVPSKILTYQASDDPLYKGYRSAVESKAQEDALLNFAIWEPPHGPYKMLRYPWKTYSKVSGALRHCAFAVMALHGCILSEIQAPEERRQVFKVEMERVGIEGAKVLRKLGTKIKTMRKLDNTDILSEVLEAAEELQHKIDRRSYLLVNSESWEIGGRSERTKNAPELVNQDDINYTNKMGIKSLSETVLDLKYTEIPKSWEAHKNYDSVFLSIPDTEEPELHSFDPDALVDEESKTYESASALSLATFASLLIEFVARLSFLVDSFQELSEVAKFKEPLDEQVQQPDGIWTRLCSCFRTTDQER